MQRIRAYHIDALCKFAFYLCSYLFTYGWITSASVILALTEPASKATVQQRSIKKNPENQSQKLEAWHCKECKLMPTLTFDLLTFSEIGVTKTCHVLSTCQVW